MDVLERFITILGFHVDESGLARYKSKIHEMTMGNKVAAQGFYATKLATAATAATIYSMLPGAAALTGYLAAGLGAVNATPIVAKMSRELLKLSETTGVSSQKLQEWKALSNFEGFSDLPDRVGDLAKVMTDTSQLIFKVDDRKGKGKTFREDLAEIGLAAKDVRDLKADEALTKIVAAMQAKGMSDSDMSQWLSGISKDAGDLLPMLKGVSGGMEEILSYATNTGAIMNAEELERMRQTSKEFAFWRLGLEGIMNQLAQTGGMVTTVLGKNVRELLLQTRISLEAWHSDVSARLAQFKADLDDTDWGTALFRQLENAYPRFAAFLSGSKAMLMGWLRSFSDPIFGEIGRQWDAIGESISNSKGAEGWGAYLGSFLLPFQFFIRDAGDAIQLLIDNFNRIQKDVMPHLPLTHFVAALHLLYRVLGDAGLALKDLGIYMGLIDPESKASGMATLMALLIGMATVTFAWKMVLGGLAMVWAAVVYALSGFITIAKVLMAQPILIFFVALAAAMYDVYQWMTGGHSYLEDFFNGLAKLSTTLKIVVALLGAGAVAMWAFFAPVSFIVALVALIATIGYLVYQNWDAIKAYIYKWFDDVLKYANDTYEKIKAKIVSMAQTAAPDIFKADSVGDGVTGILSRILPAQAAFRAATKSNFFGMGNDIRAAVSRWTQSIVAWHVSAVQWVVRFSVRASAAISSFTTRAIQFFVKLKNDAVSFVQKLASDVTSAFRNLFTVSIPNAIMSGWSAIKNAISNIGAMIKDSLPTIDGVVGKFKGAVGLGGAQKGAEPAAPVSPPSKPVNTSSNNINNSRHSKEIKVYTNADLAQVKRVVREENTAYSRRQSVYSTSTVG